MRKAEGYYFIYFQPTRVAPHPTATCDIVEARNTQHGARNCLLNVITFVIHNNAMIYAFYRQARTGAMGQPTGPIVSRPILI
jgi:hypothetical protein